jgi:hypothetical protein
MIIGFALIDPSTDMTHQFARIPEMDFDYADLTDNHGRATLSTEYGFAASAKRLRAWVGTKE